MGQPSRKVVLAGKYELIEEIGRGGMGVVWRAHSIALDAPCAIKFLLPEVASDASVRGRFIQEARAAARLRSAHAVTVYDVDEWEGAPFIAMELMSGQSLEQRLKSEPILPPDLTCEIIRQVSMGLVKAHANGLVHRDLKPDNIFIAEDNPLLVKILDFGVAKRLDQASEFKTVHGAIVGTPYYMSPEQAYGSKDLDFRADLWSLAVVAYECLTGKLPFHGESLPELLLQVVQGAIPPIRTANPNLPEAVEVWWQRAMSRDAKARHASATELADSLKKALGPQARLSAPSKDVHQISAVRLKSAVSKPLSMRLGEHKFELGVVAMLLLFALLYVFSRPTTHEDANAAVLRPAPEAAPVANPQLTAAANPEPVAGALASPQPSAAAPAALPTVTPEAKPAEPAAAAGKPSVDHASATTDATPRPIGSATASKPRPVLTPTPIHTTTPTPPPAPEPRHAAPRRDTDDRLGF